MLVCLGETRPSSAQHLSVQLFGDESGLANPGVTALGQDRAGFLYVGTQAGLFRYDGYSFARLGAAQGLPETGEVEITRPAPDGRIWVVYPDRVFLTGLGPTVSIPLATPLDDRNVHRAGTLGADLLLIRDGQLLLIHPNADGSLSVRPAIGKPSPPAAGTPQASATRLTTIYADHGTVLVGCGSSVCRLHAGRLIEFGSRLGLPPDNWVALLRDHNGTLWLRSPTRIASLPGGAPAFKVVVVPGGPGRFIDDPEQLDLAEDAGGQVVTQGASGLLVHQNRRWIHFTRIGRSGSMAIQTMLLDRHGSLWIGGKGEGLARVIGLGVFENWNRSDGISDDLVWSIARDGGGALWVATDVAIDQLTQQGEPAKPSSDIARHAQASPRDLQFLRRAYALATSPRGWLWLGQETGPSSAELSRRDPQSGQASIMAPLPLIRLLKFGPAGRLWIGTRRGLARVDRPDDATPTLHFELGSYRGPIYAVRFDAAGDPWILANDAVYHCKAAGQCQAVVHTDPAGGYQTRQMVFAADGTLWLGSFTNGITRLHLRDGVVVGEDRLPSSHLSSMVVEMLSRDRRGRIWVGTDHGLDVTDGTRWRHLDEQDGLVSNDLNENAVFFDEDGSGWFGTSGGLSHLLDPDLTLAAPPQELDPVVSHVSFAGRELKLPTWGGGTLHLRWTSAPLVIDFSSLNFARAPSVRFRYRLRGVDQGWVDATSHEARYPTLPPGKLVFEVMAIDPPHQLASAPARLIIKMRAPWWRTWPAYVGLAALFGLALMALWRVRISYLLARQRQLQALVEERTREIEQARLILLKRATFDTLTGLLSRGAVLERLEDAMADASRTHSQLGVALLDLDHFKRINDQYGHLSGDEVLREVGRRLTALLRGSDCAGRYGGEELLLILPELKPQSFGRMQGLLASVFREPFSTEQITLQVTASMGVTWMIPDDDVTAMIRRADIALYSAKLTGRDRVVFDRPAAQADGP